jgi:hypothetical protein
MTNLQIPASFSEVFGLGGALAVYPAKRGSRWGSLIGAVIFFGAALASFAGGLYYAYDRTQRLGPVMFWRSLNGFLIAAVVFSIVGALLAWSAFSNWKKAAVIYQGGLAVRDRKGLHAWHWEEFASLTAAVTRHYTNGIYTGTTHQYTLVKKDGEKLLLNDTFAQVEELVQQIQQNVMPLLYKVYAEQYNSGQVCVFGPVRISKAGGIQINKKEYPWDQVAQVAIERGVLSVKKKDGGWFSGTNANASTIPNLEVLLLLVDQVMVR